MAGIYVHVPFCESRCFYCDFYKTTDKQWIDLFVDKLLKEIEHRALFFGESPVDTLYLGGGTPSLLSPAALNKLLKGLSQQFKMKPGGEWTMEVNPDDLSLSYLKAIKATGINRLSIGIQSFFDDDLKKMGRRHDAGQATKALEWAFEAGFDNVGADLIYGLPWGDEQKIEKNVKTLASFPVNHLSAYHLTIEPGTQFGKEKRLKRLSEVSDLESESQFWKVDKLAGENGFEHYEISNFCRDGAYSIHNMSYWNGQAYLGLGPGAHSFDGHRRLWNPPQLRAYLKHDHQADQKYEVLSVYDRFNEQIMLGLRTKWGINRDGMAHDFPENWQAIGPLVKKWIESGHLEEQKEALICTPKGWFVVDGIIEDLFLV
jgi:oxygen-independent coproporphyrinogen-3 oxidase